tara:strand:+ start:764 stop:1138 length:375 start_codon:yes stop_codon:yes gene_type:complete
MNITFVILAAVALVICGQLLLKSGMTQVGAISAQDFISPTRLFLQISSQPTILIGFLLYTLSAVSWVYILSQTDLSFAYPFLALAYAGVTTAATLMFKERFTSQQWVGLSLVVAGVFIVAATSQ